jgi:hypothetical protein
VKYTHRGATFSQCQRYRYSLTRMWTPPNMLVRTVMFVGLNPSTADAQVDDPTIRRCVRFAVDWGFTRLFMANLHAYRSTDPKALLTVADPVGPGNLLAVQRMALQSEIVVCAWGANPLAPGALEIRDWLRWRTHVFHLGLTKDGSPKHPLYLRADTQRIAWSPND